MKSLQIFKPGKHTDVKGIVIEFTEDMLRACASAYDAAKHEAPLVIGHPKTEDPAYGWAQSVSFTDGALVVVPGQVEPQFAEMVNDGRFKKISPSFYLPDSPSNPVPGTLYLRHVGFLGAAAPAVKGIKSASFAEGEQGVVEFAEVTPWTVDAIKTLFRGIRDYIISKGTVEEADRVVSPFLIDSIETKPTPDHPAFAEHKPENNMQLTEAQIAAQKKLDDDRQELDRKTAAFAEIEAKVKADQEKTRRAGIGEFVTGLVKAGKILPRDKDGLVAYMAGPDEAGTIEFGEGDDKKTLQSADWLKSFLESLPQQVDYQERSGKEEDEIGTASFAAPPGYAVDPARLELHNKALAYQAKHPNTTYDAALAAVQ